MLILLLDAVILIALFMAFSGGESLSWGKAILTAFAISLFCYVCVYLLFPYLGVLSLLPCLIVAPIMLWLICELPVKQSMITGSIFTAYRIALTFGIIAMA